MNFEKYVVAHILAKFKHFAKQIIFSNYPARKLQNDISLVCFLRVWFSSKFSKTGRNGPISPISLVNLRHQNIFEKCKI